MNFALTAYFLVEMLLKWWGLGIGNYFRRGSNCFDCLVVLVSVIEFLLFLLLPQPLNPINPKP
jgi:hypothetical protein